MFWDEFYVTLCGADPSTLPSRIASLESIASGKYVVNAALNIEDMGARVQLIRKAMEMGAGFSHADFKALDEKIPLGVYRELADYAGFDADDPHIDYENLTWEDFCLYPCKSDEMLVKRIKHLKNFGDTSDVFDYIETMPQGAPRNALRQKALLAGVDLLPLEKKKAELEEKLAALKELNRQLDRANAAVEQALREQEREEEEIRIQHRKEGFWGTLLGIFGGPSSKKKDTGRCDGDCDNCPAHYGYRYGRWYYGHGHQHGCERHGDGGRRGICHRD